MSDANARRYALSLVRIFVRDFSRAVSFYEETLGMRVTMRDDDAGWAQLDTGAAQLALERFQSEPEESDKSGGPGAETKESLVGRFVGVSLAVPDIDAIHQQLLARGVEFLGVPELMSWGGVVAHFYDPDRNVLTLVGPPLGGLKLG